MSKWYYFYLVFGIIGVCLPWIGFLTGMPIGLILKSIIPAFIGISFITIFCKKYMEAKKNDDGKQTGDDR